MKAVETGCLINQAALGHSVPPTTVKVRLSGRVKHGDKPGPKQYLNSEEETELATSQNLCFCSVWKNKERCHGNSSVCGHGQRHSKGT